MCANGLPYLHVNPVFASQKMLIHCTGPEVAHVYKSAKKPQWWPSGWAWEAKAIEKANRQQLEDFFVKMRDWRATHEVSLPGRFTGLSHGAGPGPGNNPS